MHSSFWHSYVLWAVFLLSLASSELLPHDDNLLRADAFPLQKKWSPSLLHQRDGEVLSCERLCGDAFGQSDKALRKRSNSSSFDESDVQLNYLTKRATQLLALQGKQRKDLAAWIAQRVQHGNDVRLIFDQARDGPIILTDNKGFKRPFGYPTSVFTELGVEPVAWGNIALVGCTLVFLVKEPTDKDPVGAMYMAHIWEAPGFGAPTGFPMDAAGNLQFDKKQIKILDPQFDNWGPKFFEHGFPHDFVEKNDPLPQRQPSLTEHKDKLRGAKGFIMAPKNKDKYITANIPKYEREIAAIKGTISNIVDDVEWHNEYLYDPIRQLEDDRVETEYFGRAILEYSPDDGGNRVAMLLMEDGGEKKRYNPTGAGGPFFFKMDPPPADDKVDPPGDDEMDVDE
ncbi:hypothetical protein AJ80_07853 [Polytolypa hystricis UAMH7299]|uniref:Uncharacterized protein n=1 Tax=Polytolypa hystricis (strain UAMH7299) TaxID=1447883 RepID=A0A2B7X9Y1_POLH7|nr:hypothetical protein AJ80_07853 [Polytolypa hystricis UAMH7299]